MKFLKNILKPAKIKENKNSFELEVELSYEEICNIALSCNGYTWIKQKYGDPKDIWDYINLELDKLAGKDISDLSLEQIKFELFMEYRAIHWNDEGEPQNWRIEYMRELCNEIFTRTPNEEKLRGLIQ